MAKYERSHQTEREDTILRALDATPYTSTRSGVAPQMEGQAGPVPMQTREEGTAETETTEREIVPAALEKNPEERPPVPHEPARTQSTPAIVSEKAARPWRETRRPARYDEFECYILQPQIMHTNKNSEDYLLPLTRKNLKEQQNSMKNKICLVAKTN